MKRLRRRTWMDLFFSILILTIVVTIASIDAHCERTRDLEIITPPRTTPASEG